MPANPDVAEYIRRLTESCSMSKCTKDSHEALKVDGSWDMLDYVGIQEVNHKYSLELRNCKCGSTLARKIFHKVSG